MLPFGCDVGGSTRDVNTGTCSTLLTRRWRRRAAGPRGGAPPLRVPQQRLRAAARLARAPPPPSRLRASLQTGLFSWEAQVSLDPGLEEQRQRVAETFQGHLRDIGFP